VARAGWGACAGGVGRGTIHTERYCSGDALGGRGIAVLRETFEPHHRILRRRVGGVRPGRAGRAPP
jgi:hypothetical protein